MITGILIGLAGVLLAMFEYGPLRRSAPETAAPETAAAGHAVVREPAPPSAERAAAAPPSAEQAARSQPALPQVAAGSATPEERPSKRNENKLVATQMKVQKYVEEAYPAWRQAHPGQECPQHLSELTEYMADKDGKDAWGRPLRLRCGTVPGTGAKGIRVTSLGRDGERSEDDIKFGD